MAQIIINEISKNYTYSTGTSSFCSVALPISASWGPAFEDPSTVGKTLDAELEETAFQHFPATQDGLEAFNATYRGPAANYRSAKDFSFYIALTLLTSGYDLDVCRVCAGAHASNKFDATISGGSGTSTGSITVRAKYPGSFGNNLMVSLSQIRGRKYWSMITYIIDANGGRTAVENLTFVFNIDDSTDNILHVDEIVSNYIDIIVDGVDTDDGVTLSADQITLAGGSDRKADTSAASMMDDAIALATTRFSLVSASDGTDYIAALTALKATNPSVAKASSIRYMEWNYNAAFYTMGILTDKLAYNNKRLISPGWDDQNFEFITGEKVARLAGISPLHAQMMDVAAMSRCMCALLDLPKSLERSGVWIDSTDPTLEGYAQKVSRYTGSNDINSDGLFTTHSALVGPWCMYRYSGTTRQNSAPPGFLTLLIQIAMLKNQSLQYEWALPTTRQHNLSIGQPDYRVPKSLLDNWQSIDGVSLNVLTQIPDMGLTLWGNSTCFEVLPATYNALQNLSTRYLLDAVRDQVYRSGIAITFQYNNQEAYSAFYASVSPLLDTMKSVGAITNYEIHISKDLNALDNVNLNSVVGVVQLWVEGAINDIKVDLVALPAGTENM